MPHLSARITPGVMYERFGALFDERPDFRVIAALMQGRLAEWIHTLGVCEAESLAALVPSFPPPNLRALTNSPELPMFLWKGMQHADYFLGLYEQNRPLRVPARPSILDFGCGCGRLTRFLGSLPDHDIQACDVNPDLARWCDENLPNVRTIRNNLLPPLSYADGEFDFVYSLSIFTHLPDESVRAWFAELRRVLAPGGVLVITTHGLHALKKVEQSERHRKIIGMSVEDAARAIAEWESTPLRFVKYRASLIADANAGETYGSTFIHPRYILGLVAGSDLSLVRHEPGAVDDWQDVYLFRRDASPPETRIGFLERASRTAIAGWAWDSATPDSPIAVDVYDGGDLLATVVADQPRADLRDAGYGNGEHGFAYAFPERLGNGRSRTIRAVFAGTQRDLQKSPFTVT